MMPQDNTAQTAEDVKLEEKNKKIPYPKEVSRGVPCQQGLWSVRALASSTWWCPRVTLHRQLKMWNWKERTRKYPTLKRWVEVYSVSKVWEEKNKKIPYPKEVRRGEPCQWGLWSVRAETSSTWWCPRVTLHRQLKMWNWKRTRKYPTQKRWEEVYSVRKVCEVWEL